MATDEDTATDEVDFDQLAADFKAQPAQLTDEQWRQCEQRATANEPFGPWRRIGLISLTKTGQEVIDMVREREGAVHLAAAADQIHRYADALKALAEMMEAASMRLNVALCWRDDCESVMAEAKAMYADDDPEAVS